MKESSNFKRLQCHPDFAKIIKTNATLSGMSIKDYTRIRAEKEMGELTKQLKELGDKRRFSFDF